MSYLDEEQMKLLLAFLHETFPIEASTNNEGYPFNDLDNVLPQLESEFSGSIEGFGVGATQGVESSQQPQQANDQYLDPVKFEPEPLTREDASYPHFDNFDEEPEPALFNLSNDNADSPQAPDVLPYSHRTTTLPPLHLETVSTPGLSTGATTTPIDRPLLTPVEDILPTSSTFLSAIDGALDDLKPFNRRSEKRKRLSEEADVSSNPVAASYDSRTIDPNDIFLPPIATPENFSVCYPDRRAGRATASPKANVATISHYQNQLGGNIPMGLYPFPPPAPSKLFPTF
ncbi:hypothetical protein BT96DRAFT_935803 [Gymnopus androsaceus JB14]|uniref:Uncharacterized protein n=1 Tax=Gymnopus androsaceus JB14 TaxID=1447944 RepID=A0A6A4HXZ9_9AGAR|nr:hypothetical protein BT96DRAFT_935803 [Gymnopus androsaceus JB14]